MRPASGLQPRFVIECNTPIHKIQSSKLERMFDGVLQTSITYIECCRQMFGRLDIKRPCTELSSARA